MIHCIPVVRIGFSIAFPWYLSQPSEPLFFHLPQSKKSTFFPWRGKRRKEIPPLFSDPESAFYDPPPLSHTYIPSSPILSPPPLSTIHLRHVFSRKKKERKEISFFFRTREKVGRMGGVGSGEKFIQPSGQSLGNRGERIFHSFL